MYTSISRSSGGIVLNNGKVCLVRDKRLNFDNWFIPKGRIEKGESEIEAAIREIREETGIEKLKLVEKLGTIIRPSVSNKKQLKIISIFLFETNQKRLKPEVNMEAKWFKLTEVVGKLYTPQEKKFFEKRIGRLIKGIIFDFSGVFTIDGTFESFVKKYSGKYKVNEQDFLKFTIDIWKPVELGKVDSKVFWEKLSNFLNCSPKEIRENMIKHYKPRRGMVKIAKSLKGRYKLGIISNHMRDWFEESFKNMGLEGIFDVVVTSYKFGLAKPDPRIYNLTLDRMGTKPWETIFVDDLERNIKSAEKIGIKSIIFRNDRQIKKEFCRIGIKV
ncbi:MAG: HAD-IA family hydrolase [Candidatus Aenigmatarchaeota archaeon]